MPKAGAGRSTASSDVAALRASDAVELRRTGLSYTAIGERLDVDRKTAWRYVQKALTDRARETAQDRDALIGEQIAMLETVFEGMLPKAARGDTRAAEIVIRALDRHAKLFGLDAPLPVKAEVTSDRIAVIMQLAEKLAAPPSDRPGRTAHRGRADDPGGTGGAGARAGRPSLAMGLGQVEALPVAGRAQVRRDAGLVAPARRPRHRQDRRVRPLLGRPRQRPRLR